MPRNLCMLLTLILPLLFAAAAGAPDKCAVCGRLVEAFQQGLQRTAKDNFGGGNTHWEESRLGSYAHSETRLVDVQERLCEHEGKEDGAACHALLEQLEEAMESWWFGDFRAGGSPTVLRDLLCVQRSGLCCPHGAYGPSCDPCPAGGGGVPCSGRGHCDGNGTRGGTGRCQCEPGYQGNLCSDCGPDHFAEGPGLCSACNAACSGCSGGASAGHCRACAPGFAPSGAEAAAAAVEGLVACADVDECAADAAGAAAAACPGQHERCVNSPGSFACDCEPGHRREDGACVPEAEAGGESTEADGAGAEAEAEMLSKQSDDSSESPSERDEL